MRLTSFNEKNLTKLNCGDEREEGPPPVEILPYQAPKMSLTVNKNNFNVDELITVTCSATGGVPGMDCQLNMSINIVFFSYH